MESEVSMIMENRIETKGSKMNENKQSSGTIFKIGIWKIRSVNGKE